MRKLNEFPAMSQDLRDAYNILKAAMERGEITPASPTPKPDYSSMPLEEFERLQREQQQKELNAVVRYGS